jgi:hypothetical protein
MKKLVALVLACICASSLYAQDVKPEIKSGVPQGTDLSRVFRSAELNAYANMIRAQAEYRKALVEEAMAPSKIALNYAEAALKEEQAAYIRKMREVLDYEFKRIQTEDILNQRKILDIEWNCNLCNGLKSGKTDKTTWIGLDYMCSAVIPAETIKKAFFRKVEPLDASNFMANAKGGKVKNFDGGTVGDLLDFARENDFSFKKYRSGHAEILTLLGDLSEPADKEIERCRALTERLRAKSINVWQLPNNR